MSLRQVFTDRGSYIKFGEILPIESQDIEKKRNFGLNKGPLLWYKFRKNDM